MNYISAIKNHKSAVFHSCILPFYLDFSWLFINLDSTIKSSWIVSQRYCLVNPRDVFKTFPTHSSLHWIYFQFPVNSLPSPSRRSVKTYNGETKDSSACYVGVWNCVLVDSRFSGKPNAHDKNWKHAECACIINELKWSGKNNVNNKVNFSIFEFNSPKPGKGTQPSREAADLFFLKMPIFHHRTFYCFSFNFPDISKIRVAQASPQSGWTASSTRSTKSDKKRTATI